ncbi:hypothetical protein Pst134EA_011080 [Puccinia striiformis f. sp. tritici]|uniref:hypothetical protein n=1 Tax=Puccinia striiformis f. sp. tritici TaxID=168172 RepID=UPI00200825A9|nr:hypothetical protein Pst134EA_011080 [Puccinia striiformis f. sp. tritici]KAH9467434.1 hypothetical protein Pst134EA_011080 [Puccinia striiformis f. sp. tritici]
MSLASEELAHKEPRSSDWRRYSCSLSANTIRPGLRRAPAGRRPPSNDRGTQYLVNGARKNKDLQHDSHSQDRQRKVVLPQFRRPVFACRACMYQSGILDFVETKHLPNKFESTFRQSGSRFRDHGKSSSAR